MLDSESPLREATQKMLRPGAAAKTAVGAANPLTPAATNAVPTAEPIVYICPMPEHVAVEYDHPGKCPLCGMTLVPVTRETLARIQPGGRVEYYTCPMPEHSDVRMDKPGKCPRCGMTLIPVMIPSKPAQATNTSASATSQSPPNLFTCPMAEHAAGVSDNAGDCHKCGMKLVETSTVAHGKIAEENWRKQHAGGAGEH